MTHLNRLLPPELFRLNRADAAAPPAGLAAD
ncbi:hypothetical protein PSCLAVI8L_110023 [Pseudoclavibacter sp. 8L]|nr:hypothetical protein PSCLAVI8L_110023 [Pseudoclavibacter sp. 8L]